MQIKVIMTQLILGLLFLKEEISELLIYSIN